MWEQVNDIFRQAMVRVAENVVDFLPGLLVLLVIVLGTVIVAFLVRFLLVRVLRGLDFDRYAGQLGLASVAETAPAGGWSMLVARLAMWIVLVLGVLAGVSALDATMPAQLAVSIFQYVPNLLAALLILIVGNLVARFLARSVVIGAVTLQLQSARLLGAGVKWLVLVLAWAMALEHLHIGGQVLRLAFGILFGGIVLALALAVGLGSKDAVSKSLDRQFERTGDRSDRLPHV